MNDYAKGLKEHIRLGCAPTLAEYLLPQVCQELLEEAPDVTIQLMVSMNDALLEALNDGNLDPTVGPIVQSDANVESEQIVEDEVVVLAAKDHPIFKKRYTLKDLLDYR